MDSLPLPSQNTRLGFHYFPDTLHYRENDLQTWLPELCSLGASWLVLQAPADRAVPEAFLAGLIKAHIEPILRFDLSLARLPGADDLRVLFETYAKWGVHYLVLFDQPNARRSWQDAAWGQEDLVERFLDHYLPLADAAAQSGLAPVFPPLEPGGNYWDTAFLCTALQSLLRRKQNSSLDSLVLSAYVLTGSQPLQWGAGGPERWPGARPYFTPEGEEDQRGFRIFDWYNAVSRMVLGKTCPMLLFGAGSPWERLYDARPVADPEAHAQTGLAIARLMAGESVDQPGTPGVALEPVPSEVVACNLWLLASSPEGPFKQQAWYSSEEGKTLSAASALRQWVAHGSGNASGKNAGAHAGNPPHQEEHFIQHYLLLPHYDWGVADWHLEIIRPFVKKHQPTVGFSLEEAGHAAQVTVVGGTQAFSEEALTSLRQKGCLVERIAGDGTSIATQLAER